MSELKEFNEIVSLLNSSFNLSKSNSKKLALVFLSFEQTKLNSIFQELLNKKAMISNCLLCKVYSLDSKCNICNSQNRESKLLIVDDFDQIEKIEQTKTYSGKYYTIPQFFDKKLRRISNFDFNFLQNYCQKFDEVILAISQTAVGILSTQLLIKKIKHKNIKQLSIGIPFGVDIKYIDKISISEAIKNRKEI